ncbi:MAG: DUF5751 family protein, partial [Metallosphaera sp.]
DNIDLGLELFVWNPGDVEKMVDKYIQAKPDGLTVYCDEDNRFSMVKLVSNLPDSLKTGIVKDNCK